MDADKIAIMAALNIAHDLLRTKVGEGLKWPHSSVKYAT
jgi:cell division protein ZapA